MILVVGNTTVDIHVRDVEELPTRGPDEFTASNLVFCKPATVATLGGNGANAAFVLATLGAPVSLHSAIGNDGFGQMAKQWLNQCGVDERGIQESETESTSTTVVLTDRELNRVAFHHLGVSQTFELTELVDDALSQADILLVCGYTLLPSLRPDGIASLLSKAKQAGTVTALDLGPAVGQPATLPELQPIFSAIDYLICNEHELMTCTDDDDLDGNIECLLEAGVQCVVIKRGKRGVVIGNGQNADRIEISAYPVKVRSTVGAGDAFNAGFLYGVQQGWNLSASARFGNACAALVVCSNRGILGCPTCDIVEETIRRGGI